MKWCLFCLKLALAKIDNLNGNIRNKIYLHTTNKILIGLYNNNNIVYSPAELIKPIITYKQTKRRQLK